MGTRYKVIGFDADDTLWVNETNYQEVENEFCNLLSDYQPKGFVSDELFACEMRNRKTYGFGAKSFILSLIETALQVSHGQINQNKISKIIELGKMLIGKPVLLLEGVEDVLAKLNRLNFKLIVATKGDLLDQKRKLINSKLEKYFGHVEIMTDKHEDDYLKLLESIQVKPDNFIMVGNSLKSDIIPVLNIGASAAHIPFHATWQYENVFSAKIENNNFYRLNNISELLSILQHV